MKTQCIILDSHRNMTQKRENSLKNFFEEVKGVSAEEAKKQVEFCDWYESEYAVKWFEVIVTVSTFTSDMSKSKNKKTSERNNVIAGYLRCFRNPDDIRQWYIGDVHVRKAYRQQGIATRMYEKVFKELERYEAAENVISAVRRDNEKSIGLHKKMGFFDTGKPCEFASFFVDEDETKYQKMLYRDLPVPADASVDKVTEIMFPLWKEYLNKSDKYTNDKKATADLKKLLQQNRSGELSFTGIWCGNRLVGFCYDDVNYIVEQKNRGLTLLIH